MTTLSSAALKAKKKEAEERAAAALAEIRGLEDKLKMAGPTVFVKIHADTVTAVTSADVICKDEFAESLFRKRMEELMEERAADEGLAERKMAESPMVEMRFDRSGKTLQLIVDAMRGYPMEDTLKELPASHRKMFLADCEFYQLPSLVAKFGRLQKAKTSLMEATTDGDAAKEQLAEASSKFEAAIQRVAELLKEIESLKAESDARIAGMSKEIEALKSQLAGVSTPEAAAESESLKSQLAEAKVEIESLKSKMAKAASESGAIIEELREANAKMERRLAKAKTHAAADHSAADVSETYALVWDPSRVDSRTHTIAESLLVRKAANGVWKCNGLTDVLQSGDNKWVEFKIEKTRGHIMFGVAEVDKFSTLGRVGAPVKGVVYHIANGQLYYVKSSKAFAESSDTGDNIRIEVRIAVSGKSARMTVSKNGSEIGSEELSKYIAVKGGLVFTVCTCHVGDELKIIGCGK